MQRPGTWRTLPGLCSQDRRVLFLFRSSIGNKEGLQDAEDETACKIDFMLPQGMFFRGVIQVGCVL